MQVCVLTAVLGFRGSWLDKQTLDLEVDYTCDFGCDLMCDFLCDLMADAILCPIRYHDRLHAQCNFLCNIFCMFLSNTEPQTSLSCPLNLVFHVLRGPVPQDTETPLVLLLHFLVYLYNLNYSA
jgi:hypothetical protein